MLSWFLELAENERGKFRKISREAKLFVGWVSGSVTHAGVGLKHETQPTSDAIAALFSGLRF
ncbi:MAG: hypothetical protein EWV40_19555 [Microcystis flos-aquae Mf_WU_F_19750830_S460]|uniref:Uncharacterized protein n=1 Tax=Microcystis flos-aquae Mf_WU_F_19750830_S460 TaxID=2486237 RepID=A0A552L9M8_9CHRO|nr:MAG: hypothetical protein EWV40_19555 [Microcystis flos-aquae Mf_WU_F_19750830_S460]